MLSNLVIPESQISVKPPAELYQELMEHYDSVSQAVHMDKPGWSYTYLQGHAYFAIEDQNLTVSTGSIILKKVAVASAR